METVIPCPSYTSSQAFGLDVFHARCDIVDGDTTLDLPRFIRFVASTRGLGFFVALRSSFISYAGAVGVYDGDFTGNGWIRLGRPVDQLFLAKVDKARPSSSECLLSRIGQLCPTGSTDEVKVIAVPTLYDHVDTALYYLRKFDQTYWTTVAGTPKLRTCDHARTEAARNIADSELGPTTICHDVVLLQVELCAMTSIQTRMNIVDRVITRVAKICASDDTVDREDLYINLGLEALLGSTLIENFGNGTMPVSKAVEHLRRSVIGTSFDDLGTHVFDISSSFRRTRRLLNHHLDYDHSDFEYDSFYCINMKGLDLVCVDGIVENFVIATFKRVDSTEDSGEDAVRCWTNAKLDNRDLLLQPASVLSTPQLPSMAEVAHAFDRLKVNYRNAGAAWKSFVDDPPAIGVKTVPVLRGFPLVDSKPAENVPTFKIIFWFSDESCDGRSAIFSDIITSPTPVNGDARRLKHIQFQMV